MLLYFYVFSLSSHFGDRWQQEYTKGNGAEGVGPLIQPSPSNGRISQAHKKDRTNLINTIVLGINM